jgi:hypothetical protein
MRTLSITLLFMSSLLLLNACGASSAAQLYTNMRTVTAISGKVAAQYGEASPKITKVSATLTEGGRPPFP